MSTRFERDVKAFLYYLLVFFLGITCMAIFEELAVMPFVAWLHGYDGYFWPPMSRIYAACKFVPFASFVCAFGVWLYERKRIGW
jgi:hypothetical protein